MSPVANLPQKMPQCFYFGSSIYCLKPNICSYLKNPISLKLVCVSVCVCVCVSVCVCVAVKVRLTIINDSDHHSITSDVVPPNRHHIQVKATWVVLALWKLNTHTHTHTYTHIETERHLHYMKRMTAVHWNIKVTGNLVIINYHRHLFLHCDLKKKVFITVHFNNTLANIDIYATSQYQSIVLAN